MQNISFYILLLIIIIYIFFTNVENFQSTGATSGDTDKIKDLVKQVYLADVESIRNLSAVAKKLQEDGGLVTPANMSIRGKVTINSPTDAKSLPANVTMTIDNPTETTLRLKTKADDAKNVTLTNNDGNLQMGNGKGADLLNIKSDGNVAIKQGLTTGSLTAGSLTASSLTASSLTTTGSLTASGDISGRNIIAGGNLQVVGISSNTIAATTSINTSNLITNQINSVNLRDFIPIIITFDARTINTAHNHFSTHDRIFVLQQQSIAMCLWQEGGDNDRFWWINNRMQQRNGKGAHHYYRYCRYAYHQTSLTSWRGIVVSVPPGKICKIYGDRGTIVKLSPGYHQIMLEWDPYLMWAGITEFADHLPDNMNINARTGL